MSPGHDPSDGSTEAGPGAASGASARDGDSVESPGLEDGDHLPRRGAGVTWAVAAGVGLALLALGVLTSSSDAIDPSTVDAEPLPVTVLVAEEESGYQVARSFVGRVEARRGSHLGFEVGGRLASVAVEEGDVVRAGDVLARLDVERLEARRRTQAAQVGEATAAVTLAELTRGRVGEARALDAVSPQALDEAELGLESRRSALERAKAGLDEIDVELRKSRLTAPYDAMVVGRSVDEGQVLAAGTPVLHVLESSGPEARIGVAGPAVSTLAVGGRYAVEVEGQSLEGTVTAVLPVRRSGTRAIDVVLELDAALASRGAGTASSVASVHAGDLARMRLDRRVDSRGFWLPTSALTESSRGLWAVYVVPGGLEGAVERRELEVLHEEADRVFARGTLADGEAVVSGGLHRLVPGQRVRVVDSEARAPTSSAETGDTP